METWREAARSTQRAWLAAAAPPVRHREQPLQGGTERDDRPVIVMALDEDVRVAQIRDGVIVARWVPVTALGRAAMAEVEVSASPGGPVDPARRILVGHPLPGTVGEWLRLREVGALAVEGVVPARVRGTIWEETGELQPERLRIGFQGVIRAEPRWDGEIRARTSHGGLLRYGGKAPPGWIAVIAQTRYAVVRGFLELPPPPPPRPPPPRQEPATEYDGAEIDLEVQVEPGPFAPGVCVYDVPGGKVAGMVLEDRPLAVTPSAVPGWYRFTLTTAWGQVAYYTKSAPREPKPREEPKPWTGWPAPAYDWSRELR